MSPIYGEGKRKAFRRLRDDILKGLSNPSESLQDISDIGLDSQVKKTCGWYCCDCGSFMIMALATVCTKPECQFPYCFDCVIVLMPSEQT
jgi:hypothetical protein